MVRFEFREELVQRRRGVVFDVVTLVNQREILAPRFAGHVAADTLVCNPPRLLVSLEGTLDRLFAPLQLLFGLFEKKRTEVVLLIARLRQWEY